MSIQVYKTKYWEVNLADNQYYLGRSYITLIRKCPALSQLKKQEILDLLEVIKTLESSFKKSFNATMFNWSCLMNDAYKSENPDSQVHFHFRPRYKNIVKFAGLIFKDEDFAHHYNDDRELIVSKDIQKQIIKKIQENL